MKRFIVFIVIYCCFCPFVLNAEFRGDEIQILNSIDTGETNVNKRFERYPLEGYSLLMVASMRGSSDFVAQLLKRGANMEDPTKDGNTALMLAVEPGHINVVKVLIENGANVNAKDKYGITPLMYASENGHFEIAKLLIEKGADINAKNWRLEIAKLLAEKGADISSVPSTGHKCGFSEGGATPLLFAVLNGHYDIAKLLISRGSDINVKDNEGITTLIAAQAPTRCASVGSSGKNSETIIKMVQILIENGANINTKTNSGWTALLSAIRRADISLVKLFIEKGADVNAKDNHSDRALNYAEDLNPPGNFIGGFPAIKQQIIDTLLQAGAKKTTRDEQINDYFKKKEAFLKIDKNNFKYSEDCTYSITPDSIIVDAAPSRACIKINTSSPVCKWIAFSDVTWVALVKSPSYADNKPVTGKGNGEVCFIVNNNLSKTERKTTLEIAKQRYTIRQKAGTGGNKSGSTKRR